VVIEYLVPTLYSLYGIKASCVQGRDAGMGHDTPPPPPAVLVRRGLSLGPAVSVEREQRDWETRKREREGGLVRDAGIMLPPLPCRRRQAAAAADAAQRARARPGLAPLDCILVLQPVRFFFKKELHSPSQPQG
jgi:hypothetical protein